MAFELPFRRRRVVGNGRNSPLRRANFAETYHDIAAAVAHSGDLLYWPVAKDGRLVHEVRVNGTGSHFEV